MTSLRLLVLMLALLVAGDVSALFAQRDAGAQPAIGQRAARRGGPATARTAIISGRVIAADSGAPVRRADIRATAADGEAFHTAATTTDDAGRYELRGLAAGDWKVTASKTGFVTWQFGQRRPFEVPAPISLAAGRQFTADMWMTRAGVIAGRVFDDFGEPLAAVRVGAFRARISKGRRQLQSVGTGDQTDDTGAFRVHGLPPGEYYVAARLRIAPADSLVDATYARTYFPGTGDLAEAQPIVVGLGGEAHAEFPLLPVRSVRVSGMVFNASGAAGDAFLNLISEADELGTPIGVGGATRGDGTFTLPDVTPGRYVLQVTSRGDGPDEAAVVPITVGSEDVNGVTVVTGRPATMRVTLVTSTGVVRSLPTGISVMARATRPAAWLRVDGQGPTFEIGEIGEPFYLDVAELPEGWAVKAVIVNGVDVTDSAVDPKLAQDATARVVLTDRVTEVTGVVDGSGNGGSVRVVVFPEDPAKWTYSSRYVRTATVDGAGRFKVSGLPPGANYLAVAVDYLEEGESEDPYFLQAMRDRAARFALVADDEKTSVRPGLVER